MIDRYVSYRHGTDLGQDIWRGCRGGKDHEAKVTTPRELWPPGKVLNFGSLKQHFLVKFPPTHSGVARLFKLGGGGGGTSFDGR